MRKFQIFLEWQNIAKNGLTLNPPKDLPNPDAFTLNNFSRSWYWFFNDTIQSDKGSERTWSKIYIDALLTIVSFNASHLKRPYVNESLAVYAATKMYNIKGQEGAIVGSQAPWAEVYCLANGAKHVTTIEYQKYIITHPQMDFLYAHDLPLISKNIEHSGLGRYGDPIDPIGDIREMNKIHCLLKNKGLLFLSFPVGIDTVVYNAHRIYGRIRLAMMFEGFKLLKIFYSQNIVSEEHMFQVFNNASLADHYLFVLEKIG
uniref:Uncharacterized protein n=1 Tax=Panagrolaimus superbus TaxID=310955 RepID=A0A914XWI2_9BILA